MDWIAIRQEYESSDISLKELAAKHSISEGTMRSRKNREKWQRTIPEGQRNATEATQRNEQRATQRTKRNATGKNSASDNKRKSKLVNNKTTEIEISPDLTEKQKLFCLYYIKNRNATMAAIKAGYAKNSAHVQGHDNLRIPKVGTEIRRLKGRELQELFIDALDVLEVYAKIAFADTTEYAEFGSVKEYVYVDGQRLLSVDGDYQTQDINYVRVKNHDEVDGSLISEIKQGKDGISIKFHDKMKALEKLEQYLDLLPDKHKRRMEEEKLKLDQAKFDMDKNKATGNGGIEANNERILTLAKLLNSPVPNRNIEDFEDDD